MSSAEYQRVYRESHKEQIRETRKKYYQRNKDKVDARNKDWKKRNPDSVASAQRKYLAKRRLMCIEYLGGACSRCGEKDFVVLTIDHKNGDGYLDRQRQGTKAMYTKILAGDTSYQLLCWNCNYRKKVSNNETGGRKSHLSSNPIYEKELENPVSEY